MFLILSNFLSSREGEGLPLPAPSARAGWAGAGGTIHGGGFFLSPLSLASHARPVDAAAECRTGRRERAGISPIIIVGGGQDPEETTAKGTPSSSPVIENSKENIMAEEADDATTGDASDALAAAAVVAAGKNAIVVVDDDDDRVSGEEDPPPTATPKVPDVPPPPERPLRPPPPTSPGASPTSARGLSVPETPRWRFVSRAKKTEGYTSSAAGTYVVGELICGGLTHFRGERAGRFLPLFFSFLFFECFLPFPLSGSRNEYDDPTRILAPSSNVGAAVVPEQRKFESSTRHERRGTGREKNRTSAASACVGGELPGEDGRSKIRRPHSESVGGGGGNSRWNARRSRNGRLGWGGVVGGGRRSSRGGGR